MVEALIGNNCFICPVCKAIVPRVKGEEVNDGELAQAYERVLQEQQPTAFAELRDRGLVG